MHASPDALGCIEYERSDAGLLQTVGAGKSSDAGADDRNVCARA
jgi:hypothetical protein